ncbi:MAG: hypothetical protein KatS3mg109_0020 [Pirellulaceae bacterium]|nr:MAG: hypothetical protein KatS3mg109_0020 [Pirellulaceae bacterium]
MLPEAFYSVVLSGVTSDQLPAELSGLVPDKLLRVEWPVWADQLSVKLLGENPQHRLYSASRLLSIAKLSFLSELFPESYRGDLGFPDSDLLRHLWSFSSPRSTGPGEFVLNRVFDPGREYRLNRVYLFPVTSTHVQVKSDPGGLALDVHANDDGWFIYPTRSGGEVVMRFRNVGSSEAKVVWASIPDTDMSEVVSSIRLDSIDALTGLFAEQISGLDSTQRSALKSIVMSGASADSLVAATVAVWLLAVRLASF